MKDEIFEEMNEVIGIIDEDLALKNKHSIYPKQYNSGRLSFEGLVMAVNLKLQMVELANVVVVTIDQGLEDEGWQFGLGRLPDGAMIFEIARDENNL
ncbi:hypothetical protein PPACK8108_LOCUS527 [Phakopsora pachyrhizi]|uniref:Uncharacterized protein n=1 Tax=Phakopsora pachyrhizi TaxID=170000 RepID=A0AAV0ADR8_PHAPC|nr:hypothetical protein PPACK8108_LOCUS527 [Phakopsora pachyrhizi]